MRLTRLGLLAMAAVVVVITATQVGAAPVSGWLDLGYYWSELRGWFAAGGKTMWFILACSIVTVAFTVERLIRLRRKRVAPNALVPEVRRLWSEGQREELVRVCRQDGSLLARAILLMVEYQHVPLEHLRLIVGDAMSSEMRLHFRRVHPLAVSATVAPLLGLFGTVSGMISAFNHFRILGETGDPTVFAGDISLALVTTQAGLLVAIPTLALWNYFRNRTNVYTDELEATLQELTVSWFVKPPPAQPASEA